MRCNLSGRPSGPSQTPCPCIFQRCSSSTLQPRQARHSRLLCNAATPPESSGAGGGGGASPSSRYTPQAQPLKQALPGYSVSTSDQQEKQQQLNNSGSSPSTSSSSSLPSNSNTLGSLERGGWDWWTAYFNAMDDTVRELDGVDEELSAAVEEEDYGKAAALRVHQKRLENADCVSTILKDMHVAIKEERYSDAAALRDVGGAGLIGWWAGSAECDDPHGHLIHVSADFGRYVAHAYTGINLAELAGLTDDIGNGGGIGGSSATLSFSSSDVVGGSESIGPARESLGDDSDPGAPVFEVFIRKDPENPHNFLQQPAALHAPASALASPAVLEDLTELLAREVGENASVSVERGTGEDGVGFVRINVTGVANDGGDEKLSGKSTRDEDEDENKTIDVDVDVGTNLDPIEPQAYAATADAGLEDGDETIHTVDDLMKIFEEQEKAEKEEEENNLPASNAAEISDTTNGSEGTSGTPADEMVDAWIEIDGRLKKMKLEEVVAGAVKDGNSGNDATAADDEDNAMSNSRNGGDAGINIGDTLSEMGLGAVAQRVPANIEWSGRDAFTLIVAEDSKVAEDAKDKEETEKVAKEGSVEIVDLSEAEVVEITQGESDTTEEKQQKENDNSDSISNENENENTEAKESGKRPALSGQLDEIDSIVRSAMGQAIADGIGASVNPGSLDGVLGLSGRVNYTRLPLNEAPTDVFSGIYLGTFGPHGPEILQVARAMIENEEWVQGTKLTGDPNVPAGKVSFRARIGVQHRLSPSGAYPPEYGVQQRYKGQGRVAREGYSAAKWVDGELLTFSAANPMTRGAELGFVFNIDANRKYLLLFTKVKLDKILPGF